jgi:MoaA/NifB/PqqE/SkfB family radical SAM enzyme
VIGRFKRKLSDVVRRRHVLLQTHVKLTDHCNLNCIGCNVFSPVSSVRYLETSGYANDLKRLRSIVGDHIALILFGGEPLLHPDFIELMYTSRRLLKKAEISVVSNGTLVARQGEAFWLALKDNDVILRTTRYPIDVDYDQIEKRCREQGVRFTYHDGEDLKTTRYVQGIDPKGMHDRGLNFHRCVQRYCTTLENGKLYPCPVIPSIVHFNKYFGYDIPISAEDYVDIYETKSARRVLESTSNRKHSLPFCKYCDLDIRLSSCVDFKRSDKDISEWVNIDTSADEAPQR